MSQREPPRALVLLVALGALLSRRPTPHLPSGVDAEDLAAGYERSDMRPGVVLLGAAGLLLALGIILLAVTTLEAVFTGIPPSISRPGDLVNGLQAPPRPTPAAPELEAQPGQSLQPYMAAEQQKLSTYRWVDRQAGIVAIPIDRAMDIVAQQGLPARSGTASRDPGNTSPSSASSGREEESYP
jgi:hypothetical protein